MRLKSVLRTVLAAAMVFAGIMHFVATDAYVAIMPDYLPLHLELVYASGVFEVLGGLGLLLQRTRRAAAWGLVLLYVCVFPANLNMAIHEIQPVPDLTIAPIWMWARLPFQVVLVAWAWWMTRPDPVDALTASGHGP